MCVENYVIGTGAGAYEAVPVRDRIKECIVDCNGCVSVAVVDGALAVIVELLESTLVSGLRDFRGQSEFGRRYHLVSNQLGHIALSCQGHFGS